MLEEGQCQPRSKLNSATKLSSSNFNVVASNKMEYLARSVVMVNVGHREIGSRVKVILFKVIDACQMPDKDWLQ